MRPYLFVILLCGLSCRADDRSQMAARPSTTTAPAVQDVEPPESRMGRMREAYLREHDIEPKQTPYDHDRALRTIYLREYRASFIRATKYEEMSDLMGIFDPAPLPNEEARAEWYGWNDGRVAGLDLAGEWLGASLREWQRDLRAAIEAEHRSSPCGGG